MTHFWQHWEWRWIRNPEMFPPRPGREELTSAFSLCVGTKSRALGDALALSTLPRRLKIFYPQLRIFTYPRAFNPIVFQNNPFISGIQRLPTALFGDDCNWGSGPLIQQKETFFYLPGPFSLRPEIFLTPFETQWAQSLTQFVNKPIIVLHPWGNTRMKVIDSPTWESWIEQWKNLFSFWQVGMEGHPVLRGCEGHLFLKPQWNEARKLMALISQAKGFMGVDSGPMHVARAFEVPSLVFVNHALEPGGLTACFERRKNDEPYFVNQNWKYSPLYTPEQTNGPANPTYWDANHTRVSSEATGTGWLSQMASGHPRA